MSWKRLQVSSAKNSSAANCAVTVSSNGSSGRFTHWLSFVLRPQILGVDWLRVGARVDVEIGENEHAGFLKISRGADFLLGKSGGQQCDDNPRVVLRIPALSDQRAEKFHARPCNFEIAGGGGFVIDVSALCRARQAAPNAAPGPFKMGAPSHAAVLTKQQEGLRR